MSRRDFLKAATFSAATCLAARCRLPVAAADDRGEQDFFRTRGVVLGVDDIRTLDWPARAKRAGLTTIGTHVTPGQVAEFVTTERGQAFLTDCREHSTVTSSPSARRSVTLVAVSATSSPENT